MRVVRLVAQPFQSANLQFYYTPNFVRTEGLWLRNEPKNLRKARGEQLLQQRSKPYLLTCAYREVMGGS